MILNAPIANIFVHKKTLDPSFIVLSAIPHKFDASQFLGIRKGLGFCRPTSKIGPSSCGSRTTCWFKFGKNGVDIEGADIRESNSTEKKVARLKRVECLTEDSGGDAREQSSNSFSPENLHTH
ncbi:hypothetical protein L2E82_47567 [Cichorium intybus]|uniref:Uncharacterized protein n=1 Tax=Cichorium intybus TaxID=13427 RepID=A0ACB8YXB5_CICIN|nr:hypothetical protein L2E82_47567 [Cichorium intybus]